ncbi:MAG: hypothetical protein Q8O27_01635 [Enterobacteriaceae bacterium]|nr:hypothetical protein [Enterobacteriaceae bacterium]
MSKLYNELNIEKESLGEVFEIPKLNPEEKKSADLKWPFDIIAGADGFIFNSIININK